MDMNNDLLVEHHIKQLRKVARSGQQHLLYLENAIRLYLRRGKTAEAYVDKLFGQTTEELLGVELPEELERESAIRSGIIADKAEPRTYQKIDEWFDEVHFAAEEYFPDGPYAEYLELSQPPCPGSYTRDPENSRDNAAERHITELQEAITVRLSLLAASLSELGEHEDVTPAVRDEQGGWPHLRGLIDDAIIDDYLRRMRTRSTRPEISDAIGASKEIVEATFKVLAQQHNVVVKKNAPDLTDWWKALQPHFEIQSSDRDLTHKDGALSKLGRSQASLVQDLGELRNKLGTGHGKAVHPEGLRSEHALLAVDTAHTLTRFLATAV
jgi:hypothetical protein